MENILQTDKRIIKHSEYHYSITGNVYRVNFYPTTLTYYINGCNAINHKCYYKSIEQIVNIADGLVEMGNIASHKSQRKHNYSKYKKILFEGKNIYSWHKFEPIRNCYWCKRELTKENMTLEHKIPLSKGGSNRIDNLTLACKECNKQRADSTLALNK
jgi:hypothetical protein